MTTTPARVLLTAVACVWIGATAMAMGGARRRPTPAQGLPPLRLSETGLYADPTSLRVDQRNRPFAPQYPLWSDGAEKRRWIRLPEGSAIDTTDLDHWDFPVGTRLWKEFVFGGVRVETRYLVKVRTDHWEFASYQWHADQRDAVRAPAEGVASVAEVAPGKWHSIPSETECRACHDSGRTEVLGFTALQLSDDRDPLAPHVEPVSHDMVTLRTLVSEQRLWPARTELVATPPRVDADDPQERAALGYLSTNCGSCHNRQSSIASLGLFLKYTLAASDRCMPDAITTTAGRTGHWVVPTVAPERSRLVDPGAPTSSALVYRVKSRRPASQMPPIGTVVADREAVTLLSAWVEAGPGRARRDSCAARLTTAH